MSDLFISYDLYKTGQNYDAIEKSIKSLGTAIKVNRTFWYVKSHASKEEAWNIVARHLDTNDAGIIVDASTNSGILHLTDKTASNQLQQTWK